MANFDDIVTKVQAHAVAAVSTLKAVQSHGDITDPEFPGAHFHRGLSVGLVAFDYRTGESGTNRAMSPRYKLVRVVVRVGYLFGRTAFAVSATARSSFDDASVDALGELDDIEARVVQPTQWTGTSPAWVSVRRSGPATVEKIADLNRALATMFLDVEVSIS